MRRRWFEEVLGGQLITRQLVGIAILPLLQALLIALALAAIDIVLLKLEHLAPYPATIRFVQWLASANQEIAAHASTVDSMLSVVVSVAGVFLGLYFTAVSVVASSVYANTPSELMELLLREKVGNHYVRGLAILTTIGLLALAGGIFGYRIGPIALVCVTILGCFGILCFGALGERVFYFLDPTKLSTNVLRELFRVINLATIHGFKWDTNHFQNHYHGIAVSEMERLKTLVDVCIAGQQVKDKALRELSDQLILVLRYHAKQRQGIPSDSYWYSRTPRYRSWFTLEHSSLDIALKSATPVQPELLPDPHWLENSLSELLAQAVGALLTHREVPLLRNTLVSLGKYLEELGGQLEMSLGLKVIGHYSQLIDEHLSSSVSKSGQPEDEARLSLEDMRGLNPLSLILGFLRFARESDAGALMKRVDGIDWRSKKALYRGDFAPSLLERLERIKKRLLFECNVEGQIVTPHWYVRQLAAARYLELLYESLDTTFGLIEEHFLKGGQAFLQKNLAVFAACRVQRGLEACSKLEAHMPFLKALVEKLEIEILQTDAKRPVWDWPSLGSRVESCTHDLSCLLAKTLPILASAKPRMTNLPDFSGRTYMLICNYAYERMVAGDAPHFTVVFPPLFHAALYAHDSLKKEVKDWLPDVARRLPAEPMLDMLELGGYALVYSELFGNSVMWSECKKVWDDYLANCQEPHKIISLIIAYYDLKQKGFALYPRDISRTSWGMELNKKLEEMGLKRDLYSLRYGTEPKDMHRSPIIRTLCHRNVGLSADISAIFILKYLLERPEAAGIEFGDRRGLRRRLKEEAGL